MNANNNPVRKSVLMIVLFVIAFATFATMACNDNPLDCSGGPTQCVEVHPENIIMGAKSDAEQAVGDLLAGDNPQNVLSGGQQ